VVGLKGDGTVFGDAGAQAVGVGKREDGDLADEGSTVNGSVTLVNDWRGMR
jgi:hypothetical protein